MSHDDHQPSAPVEMPRYTTWHTYMYIPAVLFLFYVIVLLKTIAS